MRKLPIYVFCDSGVNDFEQRCISSGLAEWNELFPETKSCFYGTRPIWTERKELCSGDWFAESSKVISRGGPAVDPRGVLDLLEREPWQWTDPHIDLLFVSYELLIPESGFVFGLIWERHAVQSVYYFNSMRQAEREHGIKQLLWHALGHINGLADHTTSFGCAMYHGRCADDWAQNAKRRAWYGRIYCPLCMEDLQRSKLV